MEVADVVKALGGNKAVAEFFGVRSSAVSNWKRDNAFPPRLHLKILKFAEERGVALEAGDLDPELSTTRRR